MKLWNYITWGYNNWVKVYYTTETEGKIGVIFYMGITVLKMKGFPPL